MPDTEILDEKQIEAASSDASQNDEILASGQQVESQSSADSSSATDEPSLLSVVRDVVDSSKKAEGASSAQAEKEGSEAEKPPTQQDDEDYTDVPFHKHPRFKQVLQKAKDAEADATRYRNVQSFLDQHNVTAEEAADGLLIMGLAKTNPKEAWKRLQPFAEKLLIAAGEVLPPEIEARVHQGELSRDAAYEITRAKAELEAFQRQQALNAERAERDAEARRVQDVQSAATEWESDRKLKDPNFEAKSQPLMREIAFLQRAEGVPRDPAGVRDQLNRAYANVNAAFQPPPAPRPVKQPIKPVTGGHVTGAAQPEPTSTLDIIRRMRA